MQCPFSQQDCIKDKCELWTELFMGNPQDNKKEGKCSLCWLPILLIELRRPLPQGVTDETAKPKNN